MKDVNVPIIFYNAGVLPQLTANSRRFYIYARIQYAVEVRDKTRKVNFTKRFAIRFYKFLKLRFTKSEHHPVIVNLLEVKSN